MEITYELINPREYQVYAINKENKAHSVRVEYLALKGLKANVEFPYDRTVQPGKTALFNLELTGTEEEPGYTPLVQFIEGPLKDNVSDFGYALPIGIGKEALLYSSPDTTGFHSKGENYRKYVYRLIVNFDQGDTLFASRAGKVILIESFKPFDSDPNERLEADIYSIEIEHKDGSVARYSNYRPNKDLAKEGAYILAGQALGLAGGELNNVLTFSVQDEAFNPYLNNYNRTYIFTKFKLDEGEPILILDSTKYTGYLTEEMIMQEMSEREKRRYLKRKGN